VIVNNSCPSCGAVYNVTGKDIGRRIKCKKCSNPLIVTDAGLELDEPAPARADAADVADDDLEESPKRSRGKDRDRDRGRRSAGPGMNFGELLAKVGGIPTILFGFGVFLVIVFTFMPRIGDAAVRRAAAGEQKIQLEMERELKRVTPKDKDGNPKAPDEADLKKMKEITDKYQKQIEEAKLDAINERVSNDRAEWMERYGLMFGFLFLAFGCIGYLRSEQPLVTKIAAAVILGFMMMIVFLMVGGCGESSRPPTIPRVGKGG
jgi:predicted Zn finger-like uncharacterized protein